MRSLVGSGCPVASDVPWVSSHAVIAARSYVCPSPTHTTGSRMTTCTSRALTWGFVSSRTPPHTGQPLYGSTRSNTIRSLAPMTELALYFQLTLLIGQSIHSPSPGAAAHPFDVAPPSAMLRPPRPLDTAATALCCGVAAAAPALSPLAAAPMSLPPAALASACAAAASAESVVAGAACSAGSAAVSGSARDAAAAARFRARF